MKELSSAEYTKFCKRLQSALSHREIKLTLDEIRNSCLEIVNSYDNELSNEIQHICLNTLIRKYEPSSLIEPESVLSGSVYDEGGDSVSETPPSADRHPDDIIQNHVLVQVTEEQKHQIVSLKASEMGIQLAVSDINAIADNVDSVVNSTRELIEQVETAITAYIEHTKQQNKQRIDGLISRISQKIQTANQETSEHFSQQSKNFNSALMSSQQDFKSSILQSLQRFAPL